MPRPHEPTRNDITHALDAPPPEDLTRPEVRLPMDMPPDDLTEMHVTYDRGDEDGASLPLEEPFGAHRAPEPMTLPIERWTPPPATGSTPPSAMRVRTRTIAVEEEVNTGWSSPVPVTPPQGAALPRASTPTPASVVVSPSVVPSQPTDPQPAATWSTPPASYASAAPPASQPPMGAYPPAPQGYGYAPPPQAYGYAPHPPPRGTVEMNLQVMHGVPTPMPPAPMSAAPRGVAPTGSAPEVKPAVGRGVWALIVLAALAIVGMMAYAQLRGAQVGGGDGVRQDSR